MKICGEDEKVPIALWLSCDLAVEDENIQH
jgi:hypothetical protein